MSRHSSLILTLICILAATTGVSAGVFSRTIRKGFAEAQRLNEAKDYFAAYRAATSVEQSMLLQLDSLRYSPLSLSDEDFYYTYLAIRRSRAEIAYMLGNYAVMDGIIADMETLMPQWDCAADNLVLKQQSAARLAKLRGSSCFLKQDTRGAEAALTEALSISRSWVETIDNFEFLYALRGDMAQLHYVRENYQEAVAQIDTILSHSLFQPGAHVPPYIDIEQRRRQLLSQRAICLARLGQYESALAEIGPIVAYYKTTADQRAYAEALRKKGKILMLQYDATGIYQPEARRCYEEYLTLSKKFIDSHFVAMNESEREQYWMAEQPFVADCYRLEDKAPDLIYDVALYGKAVLLQMGRVFKPGMTKAERSQALAAIRVGWRDVQAALPDSACAVELITYEKAGADRLGAVVVTRRCKAPVFVEIASIKEICDFALDERTTVANVLADTRDRSRINSLYSSAELCSLMWPKAMGSAIDGCNTIYFAADGIAHQIAIEYMLPPELGEKRLYRLTSTRLITEKRRRIDTSRMLMCGAIDYALSAGDTVGGNDVLAYSLLAPMRLRLDPLPNSVVEIDSLKTIRQGHPNDVTLTANSATETSFSQSLGQCSVLHISTHGLFSEATTAGTDLRPASTDTQLSRSCLFLSGSEHTLHLNGFDTSRRDGLLSARELAAMDLANVDLTVMSACMSGLGYITPDGVFGLQRGLKTAGARAVVSTLWSVDDEASCLFMQQLYRNMEGGMSLHDAFYAARRLLMTYQQTYGGGSRIQQLRRRHGGNDDGSESESNGRTFTYAKFNKPYFYDPFILIDAIE